MKQLLIGYLLGVMTVLIGGAGYCAFYELTTRLKKRRATIIAEIKENKIKAIYSAINLVNKGLSK